MCSTVRRLNQLGSTEFECESTCTSFRPGLSIERQKIDLRRLERVCRCYIVCESKEDYKKGCLMVGANYMSPCNSVVGLYFKGTCDVI